MALHNITEYSATAKANINQGTTYGFVLVLQLSRSRISHGFGLFYVKNTKRKHSTRFIFSKQQNWKIENKTKQL